MKNLRDTGRLSLDVPLPGASARFAPDGKALAHGAALEGQPVRLLATRAKRSSPLDLPDVLTVD